MHSDPLAALRAQIAAQELKLRTLWARQEILDCSHRFCRGVNRRDRELLRSAFHPDALDDHGLYCGGVEGLVDWIDSVYTDLAWTQHYVMNQSVELDPDARSAHAEQYWLVVNLRNESADVILRGGRYIDRYEERDGRWAIARRVCLTEWNATAEKLEFPPQIQALVAASGAGTQDRNDLSYLRPLELQRTPANRFGEPGI